MFKNKPYITIALQTSDCLFDIRMNDVPILPDIIDVGSTKATIPVNHLMVSGSNELSILMYSMPEEDDIQKAVVRVNLQVIQYDDDDEEHYKSVATIVYHGSSSINENDKIAQSSSEGAFNSSADFSPDPSGDVSVSPITITPLAEEGGLKLSRMISMPLLFPVWNWTVSDTIDLTEETRKKLYDAYYAFYAQLQAKTPEQLYPLFKEYNQEYAMAMYDPGIAADPLYLRTAVDDAEYELAPLDPDDAPYVYLHVFGNSRLAKLTPEAYDGTLIAFNATDPNGGSIRFNLIYRKSGDEWILCR